ncbi:hypothetical protein POX_f08105 [Penicillium oxalicum]|uniref:Uncharacterized protein n=1 Tax=Penicillium oxalicum (strain 114-2 / CGMCC 5302) TaxID=933388 RepID=S8B3E7_PENO1|nr:hypothetical protein POX_f08105 [Penicillium oxalicum]EPS29027.1 hypothetical protein PDE_03973 [Penicillium oxalicum 114-2]KAI2787730.1 hypothetical protein POX_f08105 [Penicillium oxalicum]
MTLMIHHTRLDTRMCTTAESAYAASYRAIYAGPCGHATCYPGCRVRMIGYPPSSDNHNLTLWM